MIQDLIDTINIIMENKIILKIPKRAISLNSLYRVSFHKHVYMVKKAKEWKSEFQQIIKEQYKEKPIETSVAITMIFSFNDNKLLDLDNLLKITADSLKGIVFKDDHLIVSLSAHKKMNQQADHITIVVDKLEY